MMVANEEVHTEDLIPVHSRISWGGQSSLVLP